LAQPLLRRNALFDKSPILFLVSVKEN